MIKSTFSNFIFKKSERMRARIIGTGSYLPKKILTNQDLEKMVDTSDEWIVTRTGMKERRIAAEDETTSSMGLESSSACIRSCFFISRIN